jgi:hypothetical protein
MSNITTCIDSSRPLSEEDKKTLEKRFNLLNEAHKNLIDPVTGKFRTMAEALEITKSNNKG